MATRNAVTLKGQKIAPLVTESEAEKALFAMGESKCSQLLCTPDNILILDMT